MQHPQLKQSARYPVHRRYKATAVSCGGIVHHVHHDMRQQRRHQGQAQLRLRAQRSVAYVDTTGSSVTTLLASSPTSKVPDQTPILDSGGVSGYTQDTTRAHLRLTCTVHATFGLRQASHTTHGDRSNSTIRRRIGASDKHTGVVCTQSSLHTGVGVVCT